MKMTDDEFLALAKKSIERYGLNGMGGPMFHLGKGDQEEVIKGLIGSPSEMFRFYDHISIKAIEFEADFVGFFSEIWAVSRPIDGKPMVGRPEQQPDRKDLATVSIERKGCKRRWFTAEWVNPNELTPWEESGGEHGGRGAGRTFLPRSAEEIIAQHKDTYPDIQTIPASILEYVKTHPDSDRVPGDPNVMFSDKERDGVVRFIGEQGKIEFTLWYAAIVETFGESQGFVG